jgi:hypothetical protein
MQIGHQFSGVSCRVGMNGFGIVVMRVLMCVRMVGVELRRASAKQQALIL